MGRDNSTMPRPLLRANFYSRDVVLVARELLGTILVTRIDGQRTAGRIVETEAYLPQGDTACHGVRGRTRSNASMFGPGGHAYVYPIHARHCFNVVTGPADRPAAVLIRAIEPLEGIRLMRVRRQVEPVESLARGPARLCQALGIDRRHDGLPLTRRRTLWIETVAQRSIDPNTIRATPRIGVTSAKELPLRFVLADHPFTSGSRRLR